MNHDVAVVGGGLVGATLACALGQAGLRVAVIEASDVPAPPPDEAFDLRVSAINDASRRILAALDVWRRLAGERIAAFREMHVWDATGGGSIHFDAAELGAASLGHIVENGRLQRALEARMAELDAIKVYRPARLSALELDGRRAVLRVDGTRIHARLAVGADGTHSRVRDVAGIGGPVSDYGQRAVVATVSIGLPHRDTAWQRFMPSGPLAFLPLPGRRCSIVWSTTPEHAAALTQMSPAAFGRAITEAFEARLGEVSPIGARASFALLSMHATRYVSERVALVGDAAHTVHPLAGQGVNLGFQDAAALAEIVAGVCARGRDPGRLANLRRYERWRKGHNLRMQRLLSGFQWLFGSGAEPVRLARNLGLGIADSLPALKRRFMRVASGVDADAPRLVREGADAAPDFPGTAFAHSDERQA